MKLLTAPLWLKVTVGVSAILTFAVNYVFDITVTHAEQFLSVICVSLLDGTFGIIAGVKREGFKTYKALGFLRSTFVWLLILFGVLSIEYSFNGTNWLSETLIVPFLVIQLASALKNASMAGYIKSEVVNAILDKIDSHKGIRK